MDDQCDAHLNLLKHHLVGTETILGHITRNKDKMSKNDTTLDVAVDNY
jgi:hypothetical protein